MDSPPVFVIAPDYRRFGIWCRQTGTNPRSARYVSGPDQLSGLHDAEIVIIDRYRCPGGAVREALFLERMKDVTVRYEST